MGKEAFPDTHHSHSENTYLGFWIYLMTDLIMFATFFAVYGVVRNNTFGGPSAKDILDLSYGLVETLVLSTSSFVCALGLRAALTNQKQKMISLFGLTFLLGITFLTMVGFELTHIVQSGYSWEMSAFLSSYFTLMGTHAAHIVIGLIFMAVFVAQVGFWGLTDVTKKRMTTLSMFWFFSYIVWIFMYTIVYLIGAQ